MRTRLEDSVAELCKLKNQIRLQLNQIRPTRQNPTASRQLLGKKLYPNSHRRTSITTLPDETASTKERERKHFDPMHSSYSNMNRSYEKKHYEKEYSDKVRLEQSESKRSCAYLQTKGQNQRRINDFLMGADSRNVGRKFGKRMATEQHVFKSDLI